MLPANVDHDVVVLNQANIITGRQPAIFLLCTPLDPAISVRNDALGHRVRRLGPPTLNASTRKHDLEPLVVQVRITAASVGRVTAGSARTRCLLKKFPFASCVLCDVASHPNNHTTN